MAGTPDPVANDKPGDGSQAAPLRVIGEVVRLVGRHKQWQIQEIFTPSSPDGTPVYRVVALGDGRTDLIDAHEIVAQKVRAKPARPFDPPTITRVPDLPVVILTDLQMASSTREIDDVLASARASGWLLESLGLALGVSRERIRQRVERYTASGDGPSRTYPLSPDRAKAEEKRLSRKLKARRVNGFRLKDPVLRVPVEMLQEAGRLRDEVTGNRGWTPLDARSREAIEPYKAVLVDIIETYGVAYKSLEESLGYQVGSIRAWLRYHGYGELPPSQKRYLGVDMRTQQRTPRQKTIVLGGRCRRGHLITEDNMVRNGTLGFICGTCRAETRQARKRAAREVE